MVCFQHRRRDGNGSAKTSFRLVRIAIHLAHDAEVVQRVGEIRVKPTKTRLLQEGRLAQQHFGAGVVASTCSLFSRFDDGASFA